MNLEEFIEYFNISKKALSDNMGLDYRVFMNKLKNTNRQSLSEMEKYEVYKYIDNYVEELIEMIVPLFQEELKNIQNRKVMKMENVNIVAVRSLTEAENKCLLEYYKAEMTLDNNMDSHLASFENIEDIESDYYANKGEVIELEDIAIKMVILRSFGKREGRIYDNSLYYLMDINNKVIPYDIEGMWFAPTINENISTDLEKITNEYLYEEQISNESFEKVKQGKLDVYKENRPAYDYVRSLKKEELFYESNLIWKKFIKELTIFKKEHGHTKIPQNYKNKWLVTKFDIMRYALENKNLNEEQIKEFNEILK